MNFSNIIIGWYEHNKRDLPWRHTLDPYSIWVSEVILQQTRVNQGLGYYTRFLAAFPTVFDLATADIDAVLKVWQGLGYYTRARNMHKTAKAIVENFGGVFPDNYAGLITLKGIGDYTASAIAAFAFNEPVAAVDGNVYRIFARFFGVETPIDTTAGKKELKQIADEMLDKSRPALYNQAIMDFGGTMCMPKKPNCIECPVMELCSAYRNRTVGILPVKAKKVKQTNRYFNYIVPIVGGYTYITKREKNDIWHSLYEFPLIETYSLLDVAELIYTPEWKNLVGDAEMNIAFVSEVKKYVLSHQRIYSRFMVVKFDVPPKLISERFSKVKTEQIHDYSTSRLIDGFIAAEPAEKYFRKNE